MGLLETIRSALGLGSASQDEEPDASSERAVKTSPATAGTDSSGSTTSVTESPPETPGDDDVAESAEPAEAAGPTSQATDLADTDAESTETTPEQGANSADGESAQAPDGDELGVDPADEGPGVESISGIGPAYASRLAEAGIESVPELLAADAEALAEQTGISAKRIGRWMERAREE